MIIEEYIPIISNVGFPIGAFLLMWMFVTRTLKENTNVIRELCVIVKSIK